MSSCREKIEQPINCCGSKKKRPWLLIVLGLISLAAVMLRIVEPSWLETFPRLHGFAYALTHLLSRMWWGLAFGIMAIGVLSFVPRELITAALGRGILRAIGLGLFFDLCSHGILMVGAKLYERGATIGQTLAFLIASPWNSFSLTLILISLIGLPWTLIFVGLSVVVAFVTGSMADWLMKKGSLPGNENRPESISTLSVRHEAVTQLKRIQWRFKLVPQVIGQGLREGMMLIRWLLLGSILASLLQVWVSDEVFSTWFGVGWLGLSLTMVATTVMEICSEGSSPIAADLLNRARAPGNAFAFLMGGVATDYTEIMILWETTKSWRLAFILPLLTVPQVVVLGWLINSLATS